MPPGIPNKSHSCQKAESISWVNKRAKLSKYRFSINAFIHTPCRSHYRCFGCTVTLPRPTRAGLRQQGSEGRGFLRHPCVGGAQSTCGLAATLAEAVVGEGYRGRCQPVCPLHCCLVGPRQKHRCRLHFCRACPARMPFGRQSARWESLGSEKHLPLSRASGLAQHSNEFEAFRNDSV